jgi:hypothetical protein
MTKKVEACVVHDPADDTGNTAKARGYGVPMLKEEDFWIAVGIDGSALSRGLGRWAQPRSRAWG